MSFKYNFYTNGEIVNNKNNNKHKHKHQTQTPKAKKDLFDLLIVTFPFIFNIISSANAFRVYIPVDTIF